MSLTLIEEVCSANTLQRLFLNEKFTQYHGKFVLCKGLNGTVVISECTAKEGLNSDFCILDKSVTIPLHRDPQFNDSKLLLDDLEIIPKINIIKSLAVDVVFKDCFQRVKWENKLGDLKDCVREILQLFIVCSNCSINLNKFVTFSNLGFDALKVKSVGIDGFGKVINSTKINIQNLRSKLTQCQRSSPPSIIISDNIYERLNTILGNRLMKKVNSNFYQQIILIGPSGCGKTTLIKKLCYDLKIVYISISFNDFEDPSRENDVFGEKLKLAQFLSREVNSGLCIVIIKRIDSLLLKRTRKLAQVINFLNDCQFLQNVQVIGTTDHPESLPPEIRTSSRFGIELYMKIPSEVERLKIISELCKDHNFPKEDYLGIANSTPGFVLADLVLLVNKTARLYESSDICRQKGIRNLMELCLREISPSARKTLPFFISKVEGLVMENLGGLESIKKALIKAVEWPLLRPESFHRLNIKASTGVLLYGPPGCAKTSLARAIAASTRTSFLSVSAADLYSPFVGDAEKIVSQLFQGARANSPSIIFIDEIDALVGNRSISENKVQEQVLTAFLTEMDGVGISLNKELGLVHDKSVPLVFVIGATNRPQIIDSALVRPGRLDKLIYVPPPSHDDRIEILKKITSKMMISLDVSISLIAERTEYFSGADLANLCNEAGLACLSEEGMNAQEIKMKHFINALEFVKPSLSAEQIRWYSEFKFNV